MELRVCPECDRAFYSLHDGDVVACPHCGYILHDRRRSKRVHKEIVFTFSAGGRTVTAKLQDYSTNGMKIIYTGDALDLESLLDIDIEEINIHGTAKAVWDRRITKSTHSTGLKILQ
jgi:DNA-directed RNA polymerase subunit RPC12/RpoP